MKINDKILSIPPYISTSWKNINSILSDKNNLIIILNTNAKIIIPNLEKPTMELIFNAHEKHLDADSEKPSKPNSFSMGFPLKIGAEGIESLGSAMQHNPAQANAPDIPEEVLKKIASISKIMELESQDMLPKAEPHCNCVYCQIARAISGEAKPPPPEENEEIVSEEDLKFKTWDIEQTGENLYSVINPLNNNEKYTVFLGTPVGCTCGKKNCEHIKAVLNS